ncbi:hypothetical protein [Stieleria marina]|uniref:Uncharacterized protein n=1 Tax=Stieleria marina TaxID=1930275 RepID=A0A517NLX9_9BACT|nr:hypothetical protein K239x_00600 [Planctomycetes bacterium K23_9]
MIAAWSGSLLGRGATTSVKRTDVSRTNFPPTNKRIRENNIVSGEENAGKRCSLLRLAS